MNEIWEPEEKRAEISCGWFCKCAKKIDSMRWNYCPYCGTKFDWSNNKWYQAGLNRVD